MTALSAALVVETVVVLVVGVVIVETTLESDAALDRAWLWLPEAEVEEEGFLLGCLVLPPLGTLPPTPTLTNPRLDIGVEDTLFPTPGILSGRGLTVVVVVEVTVVVVVVVVATRPGLTTTVTSRMSGLFALPPPPPPSQPVLALEAAE